MKHIFTLLLATFYVANLNSQTLIGQELSGTTANERFGSRVDISGDGQILTLKTGGNAGLNQILSYTLSNNTWVQLGNAIDLNFSSVPSTLLALPIALSEDGTTIAFSNPIDFQTNRIQIFELQGNVWSQKGNDILDGLDIPNNSIAINSEGSIIAVGSTNTTSTGQAQVYRYELGTWVQIGSDINGEFQNDLLGWAVDLNDSGNIFAVSAIGHDAGSGFGKVQVFENQNDNWIKIGEDIDGEFPSNSGYDIKLSADGGTISIGIPVNSVANSTVGGIKVFQNNSGNWELVENIINGSNPNLGFGQQLAMNSDGTILVSADHRADDNGTDSGKVSIFQFQNNDWVEVGVILGDFVSEFFGVSADMSADGTRLAVGAEGVGPNLDEPGNVRVYDLTSLLLLSVSEFKTTQFTIYPNPAKHQFNIQLSENSILDKVVVYNTLGQLVLTTNEPKVNTSKLTSGAYVVEISTNKGRASKIMIIE